MKICINKGLKLLSLEILAFSRIRERTGLFLTTARCSILTILKWFDISFLFPSIKTVQSTKAHYTYVVCTSFLVRIHYSKYYVCFNFACKYTKTYTFGIVGSDKRGFIGCGSKPLTQPYFALISKQTILHRSFNLMK